MAYLERETDDPTRLAMDRHAATCAECGALLADLRALRVDAAKLPALSPPRDLWPAIAERIEARVVPIGARETGPSRKDSQRWRRGALLAASIVAAAATGYYAAAGTRQSPGDRATNAPIFAQRPETVMHRVASAPETATAPATPASSVSSVSSVSSASYDREIAKLRALLDARRNQIDPATVAVIVRNLQVIDAAIAECRKAIAQDPASRFLIESLNQSLQTKMELMRTAALLPSRS